VDLSRSISRGCLGALVVVVAVSGCAPADDVPLADDATADTRIEAPTLAPAERPAAPAVTLPGPTYHPDDVRSPTSGTAQSLLWHHDGSWWAVLAGGDAFRIHRLVFDASLPGVGARWVDWGTRVDERSSVLLDVLVEGDHLYVISAGEGSGHSHEARLSRFTYGAQRYTRDPNFPIVLSERGVSSPTIIKDTTGGLWAAYSLDGRPFVAHSEGGDERWTSATPLDPDGAADSVREQVAAVAFGTSVGVLWPASSGGTLNFYVHADEGSADAWRTEEVVIEAAEGATGPLVVGAARADREGRVFVPVTVPRDVFPHGGSQAPHTVLAVRELDGTWSSYLVGRVRDRYRDPLVLLDEHTVHVLARARDGSVVRMSSNLSPIRFAPASGVPMITATEDAPLAAPTSTKQVVTAETGIVALASDDRAGRYVWGLLHEGGPAAVAADVRRVSAVDTDDSAVLHETFEPWEAGEAPPGWRVRAADGSGRMVVAPHEADGKQATMVTEPPSGAHVRACKRFLPVPEGAVTASVTFMLGTLPPSEVTVTSLRGDGDAADVRVDEEGRLRYAAGPAKVDTSVHVRPGVWYRSAVTVDLEQRTYAWEMVEADGTEPLMTQSGIPWETPTAGAIDELCVRTGGGVPGFALHLDEVVVHR
jgi:hypothetical protein